MSEFWERWRLYYIGAAAGIVAGFALGIGVAMALGWNP